MTKNSFLREITSHMDIRNHLVDISDIDEAMYREAAIRMALEFADTHLDETEMQTLTELAESAPKTYLSALAAENFDMLIQQERFSAVADFMERIAVLYTR